MQNLDQQVATLTEHKAEIDAHLSAVPAEGQHNQNLTGKILHTILKVLGFLVGHILNLHSISNGPTTVNPTTTQPPITEPGANTGGTATADNSHSANTGDVAGSPAAVGNSEGSGTPANS